VQKQHNKGQGTTLFRATGNGDGSGGGSREKFWGVEYLFFLKQLFIFHTCSEEIITCEAVRGVSGVSSPTLSLCPRPFLRSRNHSSLHLYPSPFSSLPRSPFSALGSLSVHIWSVGAGDHAFTAVAGQRQVRGRVVGVCAFCADDADVQHHTTPGGGWEQYISSSCVDALVVVYYLALLLTGTVIMRGVDALDCCSCMSRTCLMCTKDRPLP